MQPKQLRVEIDGTRVNVFEYGTQGGQQVLFVHATGFHARCWDQVVSHLPSELHIFAVDMRGHGQSENKGPFTWQRLGQDILSLAEHLGLQNILGVGHSMGGHCITHAAGHQPRLFRRLILVDPVILSPNLYQNSKRHQYEDVSEHPVARRRSHFASVQEMHDRYVDRKPYSLWQPQVFMDYCTYGLVPAPSGTGLALACPPHIEASIYMGNFDADLYTLIPKIEVPTLVLRARPRDASSKEMDFSASPTWPELADQFPHGQDIMLPELTHFIPMQDPALVADFIRVAAEDS